VFNLKRFSIRVLSNLVFLGGSKYVLIFIYVLPLEIQLSRRENWYPINIHVYIYVLPLEIPLSRRENWYPINIHVYIYVLPLEIPLSKREDWYHINQFNPTTCLCLSQVRT
jgi:hypothetical protein